VETNTGIEGKVLQKFPKNSFNINRKESALKIS